jgi:hypothetical protein
LIGSIFLDVALSWTWLLPSPSILTHIHPLAISSMYVIPSLRFLFPILDITFRAGLHSFAFFSRLRSWVQSSGESVTIATHPLRSQVLIDCHQMSSWSG